MLKNILRNATEQPVKTQKETRDGIHLARDGEDGHKQTTVMFLGR